MEKKCYCYGLMPVAQDIHVGEQYHRIYQCSNAQDTADDLCRGRRRVKEGQPEVRR